jgi:uncharacterized protein (TIGR02246 family)
MVFKLRSSGLLLCAVMFVTACGTTPPAETMAPADPAPINDLRARFAAAYSAGDAAGVAELYTDDAVSMPDHHTAIVGKAAIQQYLQGIFAQYTANLTITPGDTEITGDLAHEHGTFSTTVTPKAGGNAMTDNGNYLVVLKRQADGSWKIHHDIDNSSNPQQ